MSNTNDNKHLISGIIYSIVIIAAFSAGAFTGQYCQKDKQEKVVEEKIKEVYVEGEELDEWTILQMAIMKTESEFDPTQIGSSQDLGILQCTQIYVEEVNRILRMQEGNQKEYSHLDAFDIRKSIEMFNIVQGYHNKEHSISKAISGHNPGGASIGYGKKVYDNIRFIKRMEEARKELIKFKVESKLKEDGTGKSN